MLEHPSGIREIIGIRAALEAVGLVHEHNFGNGNKGHTSIRIWWAGLERSDFAVRRGRFRSLEAMGFRVRRLPVFFCLRFFCVPLVVCTSEPNQPSEVASYGPVENGLLS